MAPHPYTYSTALRRSSKVLFFKRGHIKVGTRNSQKIGRKLEERKLGWVGSIKAPYKHYDVLRTLKHRH